MEQKRHILFSDEARSTLPTVLQLAEVYVLQTYDLFQHEEQTLDSSRFKLHIKNSPDGTRAFSFKGNLPYTHLEVRFGESLEETAFSEDEPYTTLGLVSKLPEQIVVPAAHSSMGSRDGSGGDLAYRVPHFIEFVRDFIEAGMCGEPRITPYDSLEVLWNRFDTARMEAVKTSRFDHLTDWKPTTDTEKAVWGQIMHPMNYGMQVRHLTLMVYGSVNINPAAKEMYQGVLQEIKQRYQAQFEKGPGR